MQSIYHFPFRLAAVKMIFFLHYIMSLGDVGDDCMGAMTAWDMCCVVNRVVFHHHMTQAMLLESTRTGRPHAEACVAEPGSH